jgi:hypothetical protein
MTQLVSHRHFMQREKSQEIRRRALAAELSMNPEDLLWIEQLQEQPTLYRPGRTWNFLLKTFRYQLAYPLLALLLFCTSSLIVGLAAPTAAFLGVFLLSTLLPELSYWIPPDWIWWLALFDAAVLVPSTLGLGYALKQIEGPDLMIDKLRTISGLIATRLQVPLITMGHTHTAEFQKLENGSVAYANTGTWTNVFLFPADKQPEHQMYYLRVLRDRDKAKPDALVHQHAELLCWKSDTVSDHTVDEGIVL